MKTSTTLRAGIDCSTINKHLVGLLQKTRYAQSFMEHFGVPDHVIFSYQWHGPFSTV